MPSGPNVKARRSSNKEDKQKHGSSGPPAATSSNPTVSLQDRAIECIKDNQSKPGAEIKAQDSIEDRADHTGVVDTRNAKNLAFGKPEIAQDAAIPKQSKCRASQPAGSDDDGPLSTCNFCSTNPATISRDAGLFCDQCWDVSIQAEADLHILNKPGDLSDFPSSAEESATQERVRRDRRVNFSIFESPARRCPEIGEVPAQYQTCKCFGVGSTVGVDDIGTLCQRC